MRIERQFRNTGICSKENCLKSKENNILYKITLRIVLSPKEKGKLQNTSFLIYSGIGVPPPDCFLHARRGAERYRRLYGETV